MIPIDRERLIDIEFFHQDDHQQSETTQESTEKSSSDSKTQQFIKNIQRSVELNAELNLPLMEETSILTIENHSSFSHNYRDLSEIRYYRMEEESFSLSDFIESEDEEIEDTTCSLLNICYCECLQNFVRLKKAKQLYEIGNNLFKNANYREPLSKYFKALDIQENINPNSLDTALTCYSIGLLYHSHRKFNIALEYYQKCCDIQEKFASNSLEIADTYLHMGEILKIKKEIEEAFFYFEKSKLIYDKYKINNLKVGSVYYHLARIYHDRNDLDNALSLYLKSLSIYESSNELKIINSIRYCIFQIYTIKKDYENATLYSK